MRRLDRLIEALCMAGAESGEWSLTTKKVNNMGLYLAKVVQSVDGMQVTVYNIPSIGPFEDRLCDKLGINYLHVVNGSVTYDPHDADVQDAVWEILELHFKLVDFSEN